MFQHIITQLEMIPSIDSFSCRLTIGREPMFLVSQTLNLCILMLSFLTGLIICFMHFLHPISHFESRDGSSILNLQILAVLSRPTQAWYAILASYWSENNSIWTICSQAITLFIRWEKSWNWWLILKALIYNGYSEDFRSAIFT